MRKTKTPLRTSRPDRAPQDRFGHLRPFRARSFMTPETDLMDPDAVVALFEKLLHRPVSSSGELWQWLRDRSELDAALDQFGAVLYIQMTCQTDHPRYAQAYQQFITGVAPKIQEGNERLNRQYLRWSKRYRTHPGELRVYDRKVKSDQALFRPENIKRQTRVNVLSQEYQALIGGMMVTFQKRPRTIPEMNVFLQDRDRRLRQAAWLATARRLQKDGPKLEELFDRMRVLRDRMAREAGCRNFADYQFRAQHRFDYSPRECRAFHASVEKLVLPIWKKILARRSRQLGLGRLRPWDLRCDPQGRSALRPFQKISDLVRGVQRVLDQVDPRIGQVFAMMQRDQLLDLASRPGKAPGGYQHTLAELRKPFIFMNAVGVDDDVRTLLHESGHAYHAWLCRGQEIYDYRHAPLEFCEVASMGMELLGEDEMDVFYDPEDLARTRQSHWEGIVQTLLWVATVDAFQHWIYDHPRQNVAQRQAAWVALHERFGSGSVDWEGLNGFRRTLWHRQLHIFEYPFYYIEYGIAQLGALRVWMDARRDRRAAMARFRKALSLGGSRPLPELFRTAGIPFDFKPGTMKALLKAVEEELAL